MVATGTQNQGKTQFIREVLARDPRANARKICKAWEEEGYEGTISQTLVNKQRSLLGLAGNIKGGRPKGSGVLAANEAYTGKKRGRKPKSEGANASATVERRAASGRRSSQLTQMEAEIDRLLFRVMDLGGLETIEDSLRQARRLLYKAFDGDPS